MKFARFLLLFFLLGGLLPASASAENAAEMPPTVTEDSADLASPAVLPEEREEREGLFERIKGGFSLHKENYLLPLTWGNVADRAEDAELKFQFSFKQQLYRGLTFAYTQKSFWRVLDQEDSRPFRETNYNPELFYRFQLPAPAGRGWGADLGIEHESNGSREPDSRSWNRVYLAPFVEWGRLRAELKLWRRLSEEAKDTPDDTSGDENPDIVDYYGYGELRLAYVSSGRHRAALMTRWNFATDRGAVQLDYSVPTGTKNLYIYAQLWSGYGESLIDYDRSVTRYGIGMLIRQ
jgi:phospholipase A1